jgi:hypothetical protein
MILLNKDQSNQIALTLSELANPNVASNWLFRFILEQDKSYEYLKFLTDENANFERYNLFTLVEPTDIDFKFKGDYAYYIYQMPDTVDTDYTRGTLVEQGKMRLLNIITPTSTFTPTTTTPIYDSSDI